MKKSLVLEAEELDSKAKEELDGIDLDSELDIDDGELDQENLEIDDNEDEVDINLEDEADIDINSSETDVDLPPAQQNNQDYNLGNVRDQLNGMIEKWFQLAKTLDPNKKDPFLKLGDRLSEITDVIESEFINA